MSGMTEREFLSKARIGAGDQHAPFLDPEAIWPALVEFLRSHGFQDVARVTLALEGLFYEREPT